MSEVRPKDLLDLFIDQGEIHRVIMDCDIKDSGLQRLKKEYIRVQRAFHSRLTDLAVELRIEDLDEVCGALSEFNNEIQESETEMARINEEVILV